MNSYQEMIDKQLLHVVRDAMKIIENKGKFYNHEIYLTFSTLPEHCIIAPKLKGLYPHKMSILLQQNYSELKVVDAKDMIYIEIALVTGKEKLEIPFHSIIEYIDNTEKFALKFVPGIKENSQDLVSLQKDKKEIINHSNKKIIQFKPKNNE